MSCRNATVLIALAILISSKSCYCGNTVIDTRTHKRDFTLTDPEKLFSSIFSDRLTKSEFETEAQYRARIEHIRPSGTFFIQVPLSFVRYVYRAELKRLVVMAKQTESWITVAYSSENLGKTPMQNAFGATVDTTLIKSRSLDLEVQNPPRSFPKGVMWQVPSDVSMFFPDVGLGLPVSIAPSAAEQVVKNKSYGLVVGFTIADLSRARHEKGGVAPTFDAPIGIGGYTSRLPVNVFFLAVLDRSTNNVVASWTKSR